MTKSKRQPLQTGDRFGRLVVTGTPRRVTGANKKVECVCDCGDTADVWLNALYRGATQSCGCFQNEARIKHDGYRSHLHSIWKAMRHRCRSHHRYAGRGIAVCDEWNEFQSFKEWAERNGYQRNLTIDRVDNDAGYCPSNCRWVDRGVQARNKSNVTSNKSGFKHVYRTRTGKWSVQFRINKVRYYIGTFDDQMVAVLTARRAYADALLLLSKSG